MQNRSALSLSGMSPASAAGNALERLKILGPAWMFAAALSRRYCSVECKSLRTTGLALVASSTTSAGGGECQLPPPAVDMPARTLRRPSRNVSSPPSITPPHHLIAASRCDVTIRRAHLSELFRCCRGPSYSRAPHGYAGRKQSVAWFFPHFRPTLDPKCRRRRVSLPGMKAH